MDLQAQCLRQLQIVKADLGDGRRTKKAVEWGMAALVDCVGNGGSEAAAMEGAGCKRSGKELENPVKKAAKTLENSRHAAQFSSLEALLQNVEAGGLGHWMESRVSSWMSRPECVSLVSLIDQCLLFSLDQVQPAEAGKKLLQKFWLPRLLVRKILYEDLDASLEVEDVQFPELDWLLAYLTGARPELFIQALFGELTSYITEGTSEDVSFVPFLRQAAIFDFSAARAPEGLTAACLSLFPSACEGHESILRTWIVQCCFSPAFLSCLTEATPVLNFSLLWKLLGKLVSKRIPLPVPWRTSWVDSADLKAWLYVLTTRHIRRLHLICADIVLLADGPLLDWLNREVSSLVTLQITGRLKDNSDALLLKSLQRSLLRVWTTAVREESNVLRLCQIIVLGCDDGVTSELLVQATAYQPPKSLEKLQSAMTIMQRLGVLDRDKPILRTWAKSITDRLKVSSAEEVLPQVLGLRHLADDLSWSAFLGDSPFVKRTWKNLCAALSVHWHELLMLLHREDGYETSLNVLNLLQFLSCSETESSIPVLALQLKAAVGLYIHWVSSIDVAAEAPAEKWEHIRLTTVLRKIVARLAATSVASFTLLVSILLDASFEMAGLTSPALKCGGTSLIAESRIDPSGRCVSRSEAKSLSVKEQSAFANLAHILTQSFNAAVSAMATGGSWDCHPGQVLGQLFVDRLETPYEKCVTVEQYEEVLPKHVSAARHTFVMECMSQNPFLFKVLRMLIEHGKAEHIEVCVEVLRALLADFLWFHVRIAPGELLLSLRGRKPIGSTPRVLW